MSTFTITDPSPRSSRSIQEFWIDFLLEEEFSVSTSFGAAFLAVCDATLSFESVISVAHSVGDKHGEADLIVLISASSPQGVSGRVALLIENKITAGFQPRQAERYRLRGEDGLLDLKWNRYITVLVAPAAYLSSSLGFDVAVSFESIKVCIPSDDLKRREFKMRRLDEAITKRNTSGVQIVDPVMTAFRRAYYDQLSGFNAREGTDYRMRAPNGTYYGDTWFVLKSDRLPKFSVIRYMSTAGHIDIIFKDTDLQKADALAAFLELDMSLISSGKYQQHVTIRIDVPKISAFGDFNAVSSDVETVFLASARLSRLYERNRTSIDAILATARRTQASPYAASSSLVANNRVGRGG